MLIPEDFSVGRQLRRERERLNWSQKRLAEAIGATSMSINRWEHDRAVPQLHYREKLCHIFNLPADVLFNVSNPNEGLSSGPHVVWSVPLQRNLFFTGREAVLRFLYETFHVAETVPLTRVLAISGLGGVGKTQIAVEYAYRFHNDYSIVFLARAGTLEDLKTDFAMFAEKLQIPEKDKQDKEYVIKQVKQHLINVTNWLLILDNVEDFAMIAAFLPSKSKGNVLITTRSQCTGTLAHRINLEQMKIDEGSLLLLRRAKFIAPEALLTDVPEECRDTAAKISYLMDGLPLALDQVGAYIEETGCSLVDYLNLYSTQPLIFLNRRGRQSVDHPESAYTTFSLCFEQVERACPSTTKILSLCAFLVANSIPEEMIIEGISKDSLDRQPSSVGLLIFNEALATLRRYSLLHRNPESKTITIHRLVQVVFKERMDAYTRCYWTDRVLYLLSHYFPNANKGS